MAIGRISRSAVSPGALSISGHLTAGRQGSFDKPPGSPAAGTSKQQRGEGFPFRKPYHRLPTDARLVALGLDS